MNESISVQHLTKSYRLYSRPSDRLKEVLWPWRKRHTVFNALEDISFNLPKGKHLGVIGCNGAGKSTLLQILTGVLSPSQGTVSVEGRVAALLELGAGFNPELSGRENVTFLLPMLGIVSEQSEDFLQQVIAFAEIDDFIDQPVKVYSSGMFARLAFAMNMAAKPDILIVDEALAVGDIFFQQKCLRKMQEYRQHGTVIFVSHDLSAVKELCDVALWLEKGHVREFGPAKDVCQSYFSTSYMSSTSSKDAIKDIVADLPVENQSINLEASLNRIISDGIQAVKQLKQSEFTDKNSFGDGGATILSCSIENINRKSHIFKYQDTCRIIIYFSCKDDISNAIVGFFFKNRLGVPVFGTNTFHYCTKTSYYSGDIGAAVFEFSMPDFSQGEYVMTIAIADGTLHKHRMLHWIDDVKLLRFESLQQNGCEVAINCSLCFMVNKK